MQNLFYFIVRIIHQLLNQHLRFDFSTITLISLISTIFTILAAAIALYQIHLYYVGKKENEALCLTIWKKVTQLKVADIMGEQRGNNINSYYFRREFDKEILKDNRHVLIIGKPLAGKSRAIYETIRVLQGSYDIIIPQIDDLNQDILKVLARRCNKRKNVNKILIIDDINKFIIKQNYRQLLSIFIGNNTFILATCLYEPLVDTVLFPFKKIEIEDITSDECENIAKITGITDYDFDGSVGSIFLPLSKMKEYFQQSNDIERGILRSIKYLYDAGIYKEREIFKVKYILSAGEINIAKYCWDENINNLSFCGFIKVLNNDEIMAEKAYLRSVIDTPFTYIDNYEKMIEIFSNDLEVLICIGEHAHQRTIENINDINKYLLISIKAFQTALNIEKEFKDNAHLYRYIGLIYMEIKNIEYKEENCWIAIEAFRNALNAFIQQKYPFDIGTTQNNLGNAYVELAIIKHNAEYCWEAIKAFENVIPTQTRENSAMTQYNIGNAYVELERIEYKEEYCRKAIEAYEIALRVFTQERYPFDYGMTQNNLGNAYLDIGRIQHYAEYYLKAVEAFQNALYVRTQENYPFAKTQYNLGIAFRELAGIEHKSAYCRKAIEAYEIALRVFTQERYPFDYAMTQNNLGNAYLDIGRIQQHAEYYLKAVEAFEIALKLLIQENQAVEYEIALAQNNLGVAVLELAEMEHKAKYCWKAIEAFQNALLIRAQENYPVEYAKTQNNLGSAYRLLAKTEHKVKYCWKAIEALKEALNTFAKRSLTVDLAMTQYNLGIAYLVLVKIEYRSEYCWKAVGYCKNALNIYTQERFSVPFANTQNNLGVGYLELAEHEHKAEYYWQAIEAFENCLKIYTPTHYYFDYAKIRNLIVNTYNQLSSIDNTIVIPTKYFLRTGISDLDELLIL